MVLLLPTIPLMSAVNVSKSGSIAFGLRFYIPGLYSAMIGHAEKLYRDGKFHIIPGHEVIGIIEEIGPQVPPKKGLKKGERVVLYVFPSCERCEWCAKGLTHHCAVDRQLLGFTFDGGYAEYTKIHYSSAMKLPCRLGEGSSENKFGDSLKDAAGPSFRVLIKLQNIRRCGRTASD